MIFCELPSSLRLAQEPLVCKELLQASNVVAKSRPDSSTYHVAHPAWLAWASCSHDTHERDHPRKKKCSVVQQRRLTGNGGVAGGRRAGGAAAAGQWTHAILNCADFATIDPSQRWCMQKFAIVVVLGLTTCEKCRTSNRIIEQYASSLINQFQTSKKNNGDSSTNTGCLRGSDKNTLLTFFAKPYKKPDDKPFFVTILRVGFANCNDTIMID